MGRAGPEARAGDQAFRHEGLREARERRDSYARVRRRKGKEEEKAKKAGKGQRNRKSC